MNVPHAVLNSKGLFVGAQEVQIDDLIVTTQRRIARAKHVALSPYYSEERAGIVRVMVDDGRSVDYLLLEEIAAVLPGEGYPGYEGHGQPAVFRADYRDYMAYVESCENGRAVVTIWDDVLCCWWSLTVDASRLSFA